MAAALLSLLDSLVDLPAFVCFEQVLERDADVLIKDRTTSNKPVLARRRRGRPTKIVRRLAEWLRTCLAKWRRSREPIFENVPDWLTGKVKSLREITDRETLYYAAAGWTIAWYLRKDIQSPSVDRFFDPPGEKPLGRNDSLWHAHVNRAILVAETLFLLRSSPGFGEQRKRMAERSIRSAYFEMLAAKQFFKAGFEISARPEMRVLGEDFDFTAIRDGQRINVEVTALTADIFSEKTILNALNWKRRQIPANAPAVIYCVLPESWFPDPKDWNLRLPIIAEKFLNGTKRVNVLVAWTEKHIDRGDGQGAGLLLIRNSFLNKKPRIITHHLGFLFGGRQVSAGVKAIQAGIDLDVLIKESNSSEFFRWIDSLVPAGKAQT